MFGSIGAPELVLILLLALLVLGPRRLPELGRALGRAVTGFRRATAEFREGLEKEVDLNPVREARRAIQQAREEIASLARAPVRAIEEEIERAGRDPAPGEPVIRRPDAPPAGAEREPDVGDAPPAGSGEDGR